MHLLTVYAAFIEPQRAVKLCLKDRADHLIPKRPSLFPCYRRHKSSEVAPLT